MHYHAVQHRGGGQVAIERDEVEAGAQRQLEVARVVDRQRAFFGERAQRPHVRRRGVGADEKLRGTVEDLLPLLAAEALLALGEKQCIGELKAPDIGNPAIRALEQAEGGIGEGGALVLEEPGEGDRAVEDDARQ
jgi:hypothetical protein